MAKIPVEKKSGGGGWIWLLGLVVLALLIWLFAELFENDRDADDLAVQPIEEVETVDPETTMPEETTTPEGLITDYTTIFTADDRTNLVGQDVRLTGMHVQEVVGDSVFYVSPQQDVEVQPQNRVLIVGLDEVIPAPPPDVEGRYDVTEGQTITLEGTVRRIQQEDPSAWGVTEQEGGEMLERDRIYVRAQRLEITDRPNEQTE